MCVWVGGGGWGGATNSVFVRMHAPLCQTPTFMQSQPIAAPQVTGGHTEFVSYPYLLPGLWAGHVQTLLLTAACRQRAHDRCGRPLMNV